MNTIPKTVSLETLAQDLNFETPATQQSFDELQAEFEELKEKMQEMESDLGDYKEKEDDYTWDVQAFCYTVKEKLVKD